MRTLTITLCILLLATGCAGAQPRPDTVHLYFGVNAGVPDAAAADRLDSLIYHGYLQPGKPLLLIGYGDYTGSKAYNERLSRRRAESVRQHLLASGFVRDSIILCIGKGRIERKDTLDKTGFAADRRVELIRNPGPQPAAAAPPVPKPAPKPVLPPPLTDSRGIPYASSVRLHKMNVGEVFILDSIYFDAGRHYIRNGTTNRSVIRLYNMLTEYPTMKIRIEGHVCCTVMGEYGLDADDADTGEPTLSVNRAKYVYEYLVKQGIDSSRLSYKGFGGQFPVFPAERTPEEMAANRRVEIRITGK
jgi:outer membrane protein OmpA-like peptidoglycan-associated protein